MHTERELMINLHEMHYVTFGYYFRTVRYCVEFSTYNATTRCISSQGKGRERRQGGEPTHNFSWGHQLLTRGAKGKKKRRKLDPAVIAFNSHDRRRLESGLSVSLRLSRKTHGPQASTVIKTTINRWRSEARERAGTTLNGAKGGETGWPLAGQRLSFLARWKAQSQT